MHNQKFVLTGTAIFAALLSAVLIVTGIGLAAGGTGPAEALLISGAPATAQPGTQTWYKFQDSGHNLPVTATLDANGQTGILFYVYTPDSIAQWIVGVSSRSPGHDQEWKGRFQGTGTYYLVVHNTTDTPIEYRLNVTGDGVTTIVQFVPTATPLPNPFATRVPVVKSPRAGIFIP
jgi:hypothetical protein